MGLTSADQRVGKMPGKFAMKTREQPSTVHPGRCLSHPQGRGSLYPGPPGKSEEIIWKGVSILIPPDMTSRRRTSSTPRQFGSSHVQAGR
jgi:hypothetical protein